MTDHTKRLWDQYRRTFVPLGMDPRLAELIRRAYFFGAKDHLDYLSKHYTGGNMPNEADLQMGKEIHDELREFAREVFPMLMADRQRKHRIN